ncbi:MAG: hypothetical protein KDI63_08290 [Gammaproteobacteria bacterium]|nr:hypothetical protein [Gammaproteobacteria bacterium]
MNTLNANNIGLIATAILSVGVISGCEYCPPLLLATVSTWAMAAAIKWITTTTSENLIEIVSHTAH